MKTLLYLVPHDSANSLADSSAPLSPDELRRAQVTRNFLAIRPLDVCYHSPAAGAAPTALAIAEPHGVPVESMDFLAEPGEGTNAAALVRRITEGMERLLAGPARAILVVAPAAIHRAYLAGLLGLGPGRSRQVILDPGGISVVTCDEAGKATVTTLNAVFHLQGAA
jgi:broad specificity phosphatase PhoE